MAIPILCLTDSSDLPTHSVRERFSITSAAVRHGVTRARHPEKRFLAAPSTPNRSQPATKDKFMRFGGCVLPVFCRVWGAVRKEEGRLTNLSSQRINPPHALPVVDHDGLLPRQSMPIVEYLVETFAQVPLLTADR